MPSDSVETEIEIAAPQELIWSILTGFERYGEWNRYLSRIEGQAEAGSTIVVHSRDTASGQETTQCAKVEVVGPFLMHWIGGSEKLEDFRGDHFFELLPTGSESTLFRHYERFSGHMAEAILAHFRNPIRLNFETFNACLKARAEFENHCNRG